MQAVKKPRVKSKAAVTDQLWTVEELAAFRTAASGHRLAACYLLSAVGLRPSEVLGLEWPAVDFDNGTVEVLQGRVMLTHKESDVNEPKTPASARKLPMGAPVMAALKALRTAQARERLMIGSMYPANDYVARHEDGTPLSRQWLAAEFQRVRAGAGLPAIRFYDLRAAVGTHMLDAAVPPKDVAAWLGHSPAVLLEFYAKVSTSNLAAASAAIFG